MTKLEEQLLEMEEEILHAYQDHLGFWTIGVGHLIDKRRGGGIPKSISRELLNLDVKEKSTQVIESLPWSVRLDMPRFSALVNMAFQLGVNGLLGFSKMLLHLQHGRWQEAHDAALDSKWAREDTPGRAKRIAKQLLTGEWQ